MKKQMNILALGALTVSAVAFASTASAAGGKCRSIFSRETEDLSVRMSSAETESKYNLLMNQLAQMEKDGTLATFGAEPKNTKTKSGRAGGKDFTRMSSQELNAQYDALMKKYGENPSPVIEESSSSGRLSVQQLVGSFSETKDYLPYVVTEAKKTGLFGMGKTIPAEIKTIPTYGFKLSEIQRRLIMSDFVKDGRAGDRFLNDGAYVMLLTTDIRFANGVYADYRSEDNSIVHRWSELDEKLMAKSTIHTNPHETAGVVVRDKYGNVLASSTINGQWTNIYLEQNDAIFDSVISQLNAANAWSRVAVMEYSHTHPRYEAMLNNFTDGTQELNNRYPLSGPDLVSAVYRAGTEVPKGVIFKFSAALANGYSYSKFFINGKDVSKDTFDIIESVGPTFAIKRN